MAEVIELNASDFDTTIQGTDLPIFIDLWAEWCMPCRKIAPLVKELAGEYEAKMRFAKLNVDLNPSIAQKYSVMSIPMFLILRPNGEVIESFIGALPKNKFIDKIELALSKY